MLNYRLLQQLAPLNFRDERKTETLADYLDRVSPLVPSIPPMCSPSGFTVIGAVLNPTGALSISPATSSSASTGPPRRLSSR